MHEPVLVKESLNWLNVRPSSVIVDATMGLGGHTAAIAALLTDGVVIGCDRDPESIEMARANTAGCAGRIRYCRARFSELSSTLPALGYAQVDGILADLGVSRMHLTEPARGFSFMADGPLDMRMDRSEEVTAADLVNRLTEKALADLIFQFGEERRSRRIARALVRARPFHTTRQLAEVIEAAAPRIGKLHPATKTFMALRLAVNRELEELDSLLAAAPGLLKPGGRFVVISFMSLEDRKVKQAFQALARQGRARILTKHVVTPADDEVQRNPASRSAKLRALEMS